MSFSYERYERRGRTSYSNRTTLGYWVPLIVTVSAVTAGAVAWLWRQRNEGREEDDDDYEYHAYGEHVETSDKTSGGRSAYGQAPPNFRPQAGPGEPAYGAAAGQYPPPPGAYPPQGAAGSMPGQFPSDGSGYAARSTTDGVVTGEGFFGQVRDVIRRTPSPQKFFDDASKRVAAGVAAMGKGLSSITEESKGDDFRDHERWSEEAESREQSRVRQSEVSSAVAGGGPGAVGPSSIVSSRSQGSVSTVVPSGAPRGRKRMVCVVVSAESSGAEMTESTSDMYHIEHASLLSHLVGHVNPQATQILVLIYAPHLTQHPLSTAKNTSTSSKQRRSSTSSPYEEIPPMPEEEDYDADAAEGRIISSYTSSSNPAIYNALATQAASLVTDPTHIIPFTTTDGQVHLLRQLAPSLVYIQESLCGADGETIKAIGGWVGQCCVVVGAEGAGLVDTDTEDEGPGSNAGKKQKWWMNEQRVGLGKGVEVVEGLKMGDDWAKRVGL